MLQKNYGGLRLYIDPEINSIYLKNIEDRIILEMTNGAFENFNERFTKILVKNWNAKMIEDEERPSNLLDSFVTDLLFLLSYHLNCNKQIINKRAFLTLLLKNTQLFIEKHYSEE